jgi:hypothetical protein
VGFDVAYGYLGCVASVATWWHLFHIQFTPVTNVILHIFGYLIVEDMFLGDNAGPFELEQEFVVCLYHLGNLAVLHGLDRDGITVDFYLTMIYLLPQRDRMGNWPVWPSNMVLPIMYFSVYTSHNFLPWRWELHVSNGATLTLVDRTFFLVWFRYPFAVLIVMM